jgi:hypothetical protein
MNEKDGFLVVWEREFPTTLKVLNGGKVVSIYGPSADEPWV